MWTALGRAELGIRPVRLAVRISGSVLLPGRRIASCSRAADFGRIGAINAISDVYAMGGTPILALAILGMPLGKLPVEVAHDILVGGATACASGGIPGRRRASHRPRRADLRFRRSGHRAARTCPPQ